MITSKPGAAEHCVTLVFNRMDEFLSHLPDLKFLSHVCECERECVRERETETEKERERQRERERDLLGEKGESPTWVSQV